MRLWDLRDGKQIPQPQLPDSGSAVLSFTPAGLQGSFEVLRDCCTALETEPRYRATVLGEPQMGKRGLYATLGGRGVNAAVRMRMNILAYCDGSHALADIAEILGVSAGELAPFVDELIAHKLIAPIDE